MASRVLTRKNATPPWRQYIIETNLLTKFHDDRTINVASRVSTRKNAPPPDTIRTKLLTKFHEDQKINVASRVLTRKNAFPPPPPGGHVFSPIWTIFELFHDDWGKIVTSKVFTRNTAPPPGCHVFQRTGTIFELNQHTGII
ncbi:hypothetical protein DPMN_011238 [Dreissena polymorpha]|uniref:Uncharacterized protein n=1 Tax=Dreissena polymorpha TaxID=45954 RepID=A0A9D4S2A4_DREPO|nr:hypothetical protein DPMN_011238 [Dreissena polymorpha]